MMEIPSKNDNDFLICMCLIHCLYEYCILLYRQYNSHVSGLYYDTIHYSLFPGFISTGSYGSIVPGFITAGSEDYLECTLGLSR